MFLDSDKQIAEKRLKTGWWVLVLVGLIIVAKLFYVQVWRFDYYQTKAQESQVRSYSVAADRGLIYAKRGGEATPLVFNQRSWLAFSDAKFIKDVNQVITTLGRQGYSLSAATVEKLANKENRYIVLARGLDDQQKEAIEAQETAGIFFQEGFTRSYPEGQLAAQVLGFLDVDSNGRYGIEQQYNQNLVGQAGSVRELTDVSGVPIAADEANYRIEPIPGDDIHLTIDLEIQRQLEIALAQGVKSTASLGGNAVVLDANSGAVLAMANYPTFSPSDYRKTPPELFLNKTISSQIEPASTIKTLTMAAALDKQVVSINQSFNNPVVYRPTGSSRVISNFVEPPVGVLPISDILTRSLNTGSSYLLAQLGGGQINIQARQDLYDYFVNKFRLSQKTNIDLPGEIRGLVRQPDYPHDANHLYATMTFGQSLTATVIQVAAAYAAIFNGGTYYQPYLAAQVGQEKIEPKVLATNVVDKSTSSGMRVLFKEMAKANYQADQYPGLEISGKTGSSQVVNPQTGTYFENLADGLLAGYVFSPSRQIIIVVSVSQPQVRFAGGQGAKPIFLAVANYLAISGKAINP